MRILLITSIPPKDIGGPSLYAAKLPPALRKLGIESRVIRLRHSLKIAREIMYLAELFASVTKHDIIYSLSGSPLINIPAVFYAKVFGKKLFIRPGGDFLWERATERGKTEKTPKEFYKAGEHRERKFLFVLFRWALQNADKIIFPTTYLRDLYSTHFSLPRHICEFVDYPFPDIPNGTFQEKRDGWPLDPTRGKQLIFAGRLIKFKNIKRLLEAFYATKTSKDVTLKIIGEGPEEENLLALVRNLGLTKRVFFEKPLSHENLLREIKRSYCAVVPSIFEPGSFFMLECLKLKVPVIFTKASGLYNAYADTLLFVDPHSVSDIKDKIEYVLEENNYNNYLKRLESIDTQRSWDDVAREHKVIFEKP